MSGDFEALLLAFGNLRDPEQRKPIWQPGGSLYYWHRATQPAVQGEAPNFDVMADWELRLYEIFDQGTTMVDPVARAELYREWQRINAVNVPVIMIAKPGNVGAVYDNVHNYVYSLGVNVGYNPSLHVQALS
jgi:peptide/nickel transport system substrate-binding protein